MDSVNTYNINFTMHIKDKRPKNEKGDQHGYWKTYWSNGQLRWARNYVNGERFGLYEFYYMDGELSQKKYYAR
jgi:antitoxin component YwqK of YwqJK toxin-antitoxin module